MKPRNKSIITSIVVMFFTVGCVTTDPGNDMTLTERRAAVEDAVHQEDGKETSVTDPDYDPNRIICKTIKKTGTRLGKSRDCRTAEEWRQTMTEANRAINDLQNSKGSIGTKMQ